MSNNIVGIRDQKKRFSKRLKSRKKRRQSRTTNIDELDNDYSEEEEDEEKLILLETLASLFSTDKLADVYFNVGIKEKKRIPAHRIILSSRSAVFERMLNGPMIESHSNSDIEVPDMEPDAFLAMLRFVYSAKSNLTPETGLLFFSLILFSFLLLLLFKLLFIFIFLYSIYYLFVIYYFILYLLIK